VLLAAQQDLAGEQQHVDGPAVVNHEARHRGLLTLSDGERAAAARLVECANGERRPSARGVEPKDREPTVRPPLADADPVEKPLELGADSVAGARRLPGADLGQDSDAVGPCGRRDGDTRSHPQHLDEASPGHARASWPVGSPRVRFVRRS
jgi:hypothetical protein